LKVFKQFFDGYLTAVKNFKNNEKVALP
jgi:hypothetical protein